RQLSSTPRVPTEYASEVPAVPGSGRASDVNHPLAPEPISSFCAGRELEGTTSTPTAPVHERLANGRSERCRVASTYRPGSTREPAPSPASSRCSELVTDRPAYGPTLSASSACPCPQRSWP